MPTLADRFLQSCRNNLWQARAEKAQGNIDVMQYRVQEARQSMRWHRFYRARGL